MLILPRQARDKHRESTQTQTVFLQHELDMLRPDATYISFLPIMNPRENPESCSPTFKDIVLRAQQNKINLLSMGHLPRISRAQKSDAISTFGKLAGHRACIEAAAAFGRIMSGEITSAGNNPQVKNGLF
jgi:NAD(P) transhydrogenase subunit alpha